MGDNWPETQVEVGFGGIWLFGKTERLSPQEARELAAGLIDAADESERQETLYTLTEQGRRMLGDRK